MTIREYIFEKLKAFGISEAQLLDMALDGGIELDAEYTQDVAKSVGTAMTQGLAELILAPRMDNINENGFSVSWNFNNLGKYYLWLCKRWGITPDDEVLEATGLSVIRDLTDRW